MDPPSDDRGEVLGKFHGYLRVLAGLHLEPSLRALLDPSDLVQQTLVKACEKWDQCRGKSDAERAAWLRVILARQLADAVRTFGRREGNLRRPLKEALERSTARFEAWLTSQSAAPGEQVVRDEQMLQLAEALADLPEDQRVALELHHLQGLTVPEVCRRMDRSPAAVAGLLRRGLAALRARLHDEG